MVLTVEKKEELFPSKIVKAAIRTSVLNAQVTHNPPAARRQLAPKSLEKLSALNRCLTIVFRFKSKSGRVNVPPPATPPLWNNSYYSPIRAAPLSFSPKRPNMAFTLLFKSFFSIIFLHLSDQEIWRQEVEFICSVLWVYYFSPD